MPALLLALVALILAGPGPRLMARFTGFRRSPGPALFAWQAVGLSAVVSALLVGPAVVLHLLDHGDASWDSPVLATVIAAAAAVGSAAALVLLLISGHQVGTGLRALRRRHRDLVDLLALPAGAKDLPSQVRVIEGATLTAYCLPGLRRRIVLTQGALAGLPADELAAVLAHERAHLGGRHDLLLEFFTVLHHAVPAHFRCDAALREVHLLVEALADRVALRHAGARPLARALVAMAGGTHPDASLGMAQEVSPTRVRLELIAAAARPARVLTTVISAYTIAILLTPWALFAWAL